MAWRPIETAPKNGDSVLVAADSLSPCDAWWGKDDYQEGWRDVLGMIATQPTHWQPLPVFLRE